MISSPIQESSQVISTQTQSLLSNSTSNSTTNSASNSTSTFSLNTPSLFQLFNQVYAAVQQESAANSNTYANETQITIPVSPEQASTNNSGMSAIPNADAYSAPTNMQSAPTSSTTDASNSASSNLGKYFQFDSIVQNAATTYHLSSNLLLSMIQTESNFNPNAVSPDGAEGLMQLMPATAASLGVTNAFDPTQNIMAGAAYMRQLLDKYNNSIPLALAAYNAGPSAVDRYGGIPPYPETEQYVQKILGNT